MENYTTWWHFFAPSRLNQMARLSKSFYFRSSQPPWRFSKTTSQRQNNFLDFSSLRRCDLSNSLPYIASDNLVAWTARMQILQQQLNQLERLIQILLQSKFAFIPGHSLKCLMLIFLSARYLPFNISLYIIAQ